MPNVPHFVPGDSCITFNNSWRSSSIRSILASTSKNSWTVGSDPFKISMIRIMSQKKTPQKKVEQKKLHCRDCKHIDLYDFYLTNPLHHLRNLFQLLVDAVLEILGQVCDSLLVFWMRLVEKMLTSPPPTKKNNWQESISIQEWWKILDGLSCSHCSKIPGLNFFGEIS